MSEDLYDRCRNKVNRTRISVKDSSHWHGTPDSTSDGGVSTRQKVLSTIFLTAILPNRSTGFKGKSTICRAYIKYHMVVIDSSGMRAIEIQIRSGY